MNTSGAGANGIPTGLTMEIVARRIRRRTASQFVLRALRCSLPALLLSAMMVSSASAEPIYSKSRRFRIPFQFDSAELKRLGAKEVQLSVSRDSGASWNTAETVSPQAARFTFEAVDDGEYWFSVKTITSSGLEYPAGPHEPTLQVIIDTEAPRLHLQFSEDDPGRVRLAWETQDPNLDLESLRLEFTEPDSAAWQPVSMRPQEQGQTVWTASRTGKMFAKGSVSDRAGNVAEATAEVLISGSPSEENSTPDYSRPIAKDQTKPAPSSVGGANAPASVTPHLTASTNAPQISNAAATTPLTNPAADKAPAAAATVPPSTTTPPAAPKRTAHIVNSKSFRIAYEIDGVGASGVAAVELYITEDGGKKWFNYGKDPDRVSPFDVVVPGDGEYGFAFRVANGVGVVASPPQPGDRPEVIVLVDRVPPVLQLHPIQQGTGAENGQIILTWSAQDRELHDRPISLSFATRPSGPWEQIGDWLPNTGKYVWTVPASLTEKFYIRVEARDQAGNVTRVDSEQPFLVDRSRPQVRVTEVQPIGSEQR
ncbi:Ig-like domain repeat protein [Planctomicrobium sp. SH664]|uniref:Ig-like domain repeat protein n=1 Tax=Planctomicrobium sp. SH664 TaxID=3448125 RepID=UPI003F5C3848